MIMKRILSVALSMAVSVSAFAQMDNVVEVESSYKPVVRDANKINVLPDVEDVKAKHYSVEYATNGNTLQEYVFQPMGVANSAVADKGAKRGYATLAGGNEGNLLGRIAYGFVFTPKDYLDVDFRLSGHNAKVENTANDFAEDWKSRFYSTKIGASYEHKLTPQSSVIVSGGYESQVYNYQSYYYSSSGITDKQHNNLGNFSAKLTPYSFGNFSIGAEIGYEFFNQKYVNTLNEKNTEGKIDAGVRLGYQLEKNNRIGLDLDLQSYNYSNNDFDNNNIFIATPYYSFRSGDIAMRIGLKVSGTSGLESKFRIAPDVRFDFAVDKSVKIYAEATGGVAANDFRTLNLMSPYWAYNLSGETGQLKNRFDQLMATGGLVFNITEGFQIDLSAGYDISKNRAELAPLSFNHPAGSDGLFSGTFNTDEGNYYTPVFTSDGNLLRFNASVLYKYKDIVSVNLSNQFNNWTIDDEQSVYLNDIIWRPAIDLNWNASFRIYDTLRFSLDWTFQTFSDDEQASYERPNTCNLGASLSYTLPIGLSIYAKGDNLLNKDYDNYLGYRAPGINFILGLAMTF